LMIGIREIFKVSPSQFKKLTRNCVSAKIGLLFPDLLVEPKR